MASFGAMRGVRALRGPHRRGPVLEMRALKRSVAAAAATERFKALISRTGPRRCGPRRALTPRIAPKLATDAILLRRRLKPFYSSPYRASWTLLCNMENHRRLKPSPPPSPTL